MRTHITCRPLSTWPGPRTPSHSVRRSQFGASWSATASLLDRELDQLGATVVALELDVTEADIRLDGWPRAGARPATPGVVISFGSRYGPLRYSCDRFDRWQDNVRAIALGLESLRRVDRYGITKRGEQYTGWKALPAGGGLSRDDARTLIDSYGGVAAALKATHPDTGGDPDAFERVQQAREVLA